VITRVAFGVFLGLLLFVLVVTIIVFAASSTLRPG